MKITINIMTGNWFHDGEPEVGKAIKAEVGSIEELDTILGDIEEGADYFIVLDEDGSEVTVSDLCNILDAC